MNKVEFYIKCGEIFKSQEKDDNPFMLRCIQCSEVYLLLESFILHFEDECLKDTIKKENNVANKEGGSTIKRQKVFGMHNYSATDELAHKMQSVKKSLDIQNVNKSQKKLKTKKEPRMPKLLPKEIENFIEIYKEFPHLWNTSLVEFHCTNKKNESIQEMLQALATKINIQISEQLLREYLQRLHTSFSRAKRKKLNLRMPKTSNDFSVKGNLEDFYENMSFLSDHVAPFRCPDCDKEINGANSYKIHRSEHSGLAPFPCSACSREFTSSTTYISHAKRHMGDVKYECNECNKKFYIERDMNLHMLEHTGAKPFCCEICGTSFRHVQSFTIHRRKHEKNYLHTCHLCSRGFYTMELYKDHMNSHTNTRTHICQVCGKAFINKKGLRVHEIIHDDVRKHACKVCDKTFKHKSGLHQHMRTHAIAKYEENNSINSYLDVYIN